MQEAEAATDGFSVYVGYAGGPFYEKAHFTDAQLRSMSDGVIYEYSALDSAEYLRKGFATGVELSAILSAAGIQPEAMWRFYLGTGDGYVADSDSYGTNGEAWYYGNLIGTNRFYYPAIPQNSEFKDNKFYGIYEEGYNSVLESAVAVPTIIATESAFARIGSATSEQWDYQPISANSGYRLMFGQTAPTEITARDSAMNISAITCVLGGSTGKNIPKIEMGGIIEALQDTHVGGSLTFTPGLSNVMDKTILNQGIKDIVIETDNPDVLGVVQNADGSWTISVLQSGNAKLMVHFGNSTDGDFVSSYIGDASCGDGNGQGDGGGLGDVGAGDGAGDLSDGEGTGSAAGEDTSGDGGGTIALAADTPLLHVSLRPVNDLDSASGSDGAESNSDSSRGSLGDVYELVFDDDEELPRTDKSDLSTLFIAVLGLLGFGGIRKAGAFELSKDRNVRT